MKSFADNTERTWTISLTIDAAKRVKGLLGVNLLELEQPWASPGSTASSPPSGSADLSAEALAKAEAPAKAEPLLTKLGTDVILLCDVIYALVKPQADAAGVTDEQFGAALGGEAILAAQTAFYEELVDFFRKLGRTDLAKAVDAQRRVIDLTVRRIETRIDRLDLEAAVSQTLSEVEGSESNRGEPSTNLPGSSESTPAR